jgi:hypothetical protein
MGILNVYEQYAWLKSAKSFKATYAEGSEAYEHGIKWELAASVELIDWWAFYFKKLNRNAADVAEADKVIAWVRSASKISSEVVQSAVLDLADEIVNQLKNGGAVLMPACIREEGLVVWYFSPALEESDRISIYNLL